MLYAFGVFENEAPGIYFSEFFVESLLKGVFEVVFKYVCFLNFYYAP